MGDARQAVETSNLHKSHGSLEVLKGFDKAADKGKGVKNGS